MLVRAMTGRIALIAVVLLAAAPLGAAVISDFPDGPLNLPNGPQIGAVNGEALSLRLAARGGVVLRRGDVDQVMAPPRRSRDRVSLPVLYVDGAGVHAFWRVKLAAKGDEGKPGDKLLYVRSSVDGGKTFGPPHRLNLGGGAFQARVAGNGQGAVYAVWVDERAGYHLYLNRTTDGGKSWQTRDLQIDHSPRRPTSAYDPAVVAAGDRVWVAWVEANLGQARQTDARGKEERPIESFSLVFRGATDRGETWSDPVVLKDLPTQPSAPVLVRSGGSLFVYWFAGEGLEGTRSDDGGRTWTAVTGLPKVDEELGGLTGAVEPSSGRVILAYILTRDGGRPTIWVASSADGMRFDAPIHLPTKMPYLTTAVLPEIVAAPNGTVLALWQDMRYLRSTICARVSKDGGRTWLARDACLDEHPGKFPAMYGRGVADGKGGFFAQWVRFTDDHMQKPQVVLVRVDPERLPDGRESDRFTRARLEERVGGFWKTRVAADWSGSYDFLDPIFRGRIRREAYIGTQGVVKYYDFTIEKLELTERIARATIRYTLEIPVLDVMGKRHTVPKREETTTQDWVFMDDDWHVLFKDPMNQTFLQY